MKMHALIYIYMCSAVFFALCKVKKIARKFCNVKKIADICKVCIANLSVQLYEIMAKARVSINPMYKGGAGGYTFYVRGGEQVVRQRRNNSNYGESASRTRAQMIRRIMWGNLVNVYKSIKSWQQKAYDSKAIGQTDYNLFMKLNIAMASVGVTKAACEQGFAVFENYQVSKGSLPPIVYDKNDQLHHIVTNIIYTQAITSSTTVGEFSAEIVAKNPQFQAGDNIAVIFCRNHQWIGAEWPYAYSIYTEVTLNVSDTRLITDITDLGERLTKGASDTLDVNYTAPSPGGDPVVEGVAIIHTRKVNGQLFVSSQNIVMETDQFIQRYSGDEWYNHCIESYGIQVDVPLDPNFNQGIITRVTANDAALQNAAVLSGSQTIRVYGNKLYGNGYSFVHNGIVYTPLSSTDEYDEFILTDNGSYIIYIDDQIFMSFSVSGIVTPSELSGQVNAALKNPTSGTVTFPLSTSSGCLNYPHVANEDYPQIVCDCFYNEGYEYDEDDFSCEGGVITSMNDVPDRSFVALRLSPTDSSTPLVVRFKDYIFLVANYEID